MWCGPCPARRCRALQEATPPAPCQCPSAIHHVNTSCPAALRAALTVRVVGAHHPLPRLADLEAAHRLVEAGHQILCWWQGGGASCERYGQRAGRRHASGGAGGMGCTHEMHPSSSAVLQTQRKHEPRSATGRLQAKTAEDRAPAPLPRMNCACLPPSERDESNTLPSSMML